jgi:hypothetical protein
MLRAVAGRIAGKGKPLPEKTTIGGGPNGDSLALKEIAAKMAGMSPNDASALSNIATRLTACSPEKKNKPCQKPGADEGNESEDAKALKDVAVKLMKLAEPPAESPSASKPNDLWQQVKALENGFNAAGATSKAEDDRGDDPADSKGDAATGASGAAKDKTPLEKRVEELEKGILGGDGSSSDDANGSSGSSSSSGSGKGKGSGKDDGGDSDDDSPSSSGSGKGSSAKSGSGSSSASGTSGSSGSGSSSDSGGLWKRPKVVRRGGLPNGVDIKAGKGDGRGKQQGKPCPPKQAPLPKDDDCA